MEENEFFQVNNGEVKVQVFSRCLFFDQTGKPVLTQRPFWQKTVLSTNRCGQGKNEALDTLTNNLGLHTILFANYSEDRWKGLER